MGIDLDGRSVAITGASSGIGESTAYACARAGMPVALFARRAERLEEVCTRIEADGGRAIVVVGSVDDDDDCARLIQETKDAFGTVDAVIANAGYGIETASSDMPEADIRAMFETNFYGSLRVLRPALPIMREQGSGHLMFVSSGLSKIGIPRFAAYCATKAAQDHFARAMRIELAGEGIAVSSVHPVVTTTEFSEAAERRGKNRRVFTKRTPGLFTQSAETVSSAIVKRLRKGKGGEVWTSLPARLGLGVTVMFPGMTDRALARTYKKRIG
ncbi:MAG: SDR family oxidoreductase [Planctomycetota bacterium]